MNEFASDGVFLWFVYEMNNWLVKRPTIVSYWLRCLFLCVEGIDKDGTDTTLKTNINNTIVAMGVLKDVVLIIIVASGIVGICCTASGVRMYLDITNDRNHVLEGVCDDIKCLSYINMSLGALLLIVSIVIGILVYGIRF